MSWTIWVMSLINLEHLISIACFLNYKLSYNVQYFDMDKQFSCVSDKHLEVVRFIL